MSRSRLAGASSRVLRALAIVLAAVAGTAVAVLSPAATSEARADGPYFQLTETVVDKNVWPAGQWQLSDGALVMDLYMDGKYTARFNWSSPPAAFDASGFDISLNVAGNVQLPCNRMYAGTGVWAADFETSPESALTEIHLEPKENCDPATAGGLSGANSASVHLKPRDYVSDGSVVEIKAGAAFGPGVTYRYTVSNTRPPLIGGGGGNGGGGGMQGTLAATLECDSDRIVISALPSLNCHIVFTSWRRNTADPVEVSFPTELDTFGNHSNGIQLNGRGSEDVFNWDSPHNWGLFVFACPSQQGTGANCYGSVTTPGAVSVPILVTQKGTQPLNLMLTLNAVARGGGGGGGGGGGLGAGGQVARLGNRWMSGNFINIESGPLVSGPIHADWLSAQWQFEQVAGTEFVRLKNVWKPDMYIHCEHGPLEVGQISADWWSAMWVVEPVEGTSYIRLRNRWHGDQYINTETGALQLGPVQPDWWSAMWWTLP